MVRTLTLAVAVCLSGVLGAQTSPPTITQQGRIDNMSKIRPVTGVSEQDMQFLVDARAANWLEIKTSELAATHASSDWVKMFASEMLTEHKAAQDELFQVVQKEGIELPADVPKKVEAVVTKLEALTGQQFDTAYRDLQIKGHQMVADKFAAEIKNGHDSQVRYYAINTLPAVKMHLKMAINKTTMTHP